MIKKSLVLFKLMRLHQAIKNLFIFMPLFFAGLIFDSQLLHQALLAFVSFTLVASAVYIFNDFRDIEEDRLHPKKKLRPLAASEVSVHLAIITLFVLLILGSGLMYLTSVAAFKVLMTYVLMNLAYSLVLKKVAIIDVSIIAVGFVLRLLIGSLVTDVALSMWIVAMTFLLALFIALAKRRDDVLIYQQTGQQMRSAIKGYNLKFLDASLVIIAAVTIVAYFLYCISPEITDRLHTDYLYISTVFVILGFLRYLQITFVDKNSGSPIQLVFSDVFLQTVIVMWLLFFSWMLYQ
ncbi:MAG: decaprenyl-phosphate phosphoribosyltransferase [Marinicellaceae bacterium]